MATISGKTKGAEASADKVGVDKGKTPRLASTKAKSKVGTGAEGKSKAQQALANTRALLQTKQAHDRETPAWHALDSKTRGKPTKPGYQSEEAKMRSTELHEGEMHLKGIEGSISTQDRSTQGKRECR